MCQPAGLLLTSFGWFCDIDGALPPPPVAIGAATGHETSAALLPLAVAVTTVTTATPLRPAAPCGPVSPALPLAP